MRWKKKEGGGKIYSMGKNKKRKKSKYKNIQEKEGLIFFSLSARVLGHAVFCIQMYTRPKV